jgi:hypothetical protein
MINREVLMNLYCASLMACLMSLTPALAAVDVEGTPSGDGNPNAVVCRAPQMQPGSRLLGPRVCKINATWAQYRKDGLEVAADGVQVVPGEKYRSLHPGACRPATPGGSAAGTMMQANMSALCD